MEDVITPRVHLIMRKEIILEDGTVISTNSLDGEHYNVELPSHLFYLLFVDQNDIKQYRNFESMKGTKTRFNRFHAVPVIGYHVLLVERHGCLGYLLGIGNTVKDVYESPIKEIETLEDYMI